MFHKYKFGFQNHRLSSERATMTVTAVKIIRAPSTTRTVSVSPNTVTPIIMAVTGSSAPTIAL